MNIFEYIFQDWKCNKKNIKGRFVLINYRFAQIIKKNKLLFILGFWQLILYSLIIEWFMGVELNWKVRAGKNLQLHHGFGSVIHPGVIIGDNCVLRHCTTIGNKGITTDDVPTIGNNVNIGANTSILGKIIIGDNVIIGAGSVVIRNVPSDCVIAGNPAKIIRQL
jgi:putative colanic acid biosynthesis acetyltransferase WcaB